MIKKVKDTLLVIWYCLTVGWIPSNTGRYEIDSPGWVVRQFGDHTPRYWRRKAAQGFADRLNAYHLGHPMYGPRYLVRDRWSGRHV